MSRRVAAESAHSSRRVRDSDPEHAMLGRLRLQAEPQLAALVDRGRRLSGRDAVADGVHLALATRHRLSSASGSHRSGAFTVASTSASASMRRCDSSSRSITVAPSPCHALMADSTANSTPRRRRRSRSGQSAEVRTISRPTNGSGVTTVTACPRSAEMPRSPAAAPRAGVVEHDDPVSGSCRAAHDVLDRKDVGPVDAG